MKIHRVFSVFVLESINVKSNRNARSITWPWAVFRGTCLPPGTPSSHDPEIWEKRYR